MSGPLIVTIPHKLGKEEALRRVKPALSRASESFPVLKVEQEVWSGDRMEFRVRAMGQVAAGNIQVGDNDVRLEVTLPWQLRTNSVRPFRKLSPAKAESSWKRSDAFDAPLERQLPVERGCDCTVYSSSCPAPFWRYP